MPLDGMRDEDEPRGPRCASCHEPLVDGQRVRHVHFSNDPHGFRGLTGKYHEACSRPFVSLAHVINLTHARGF